MKVANKIKQLRFEKGMTTYEISEITGISQSTISKIENKSRKIDIESLGKIANALNVHINYFFEDFGDKNNFDKKCLGKNIRTLRKKKGKTQQEMAKDLGISRSALGMYEIDDNDMSTKMLLKIANYFNASTDYLLGNSKHQNHSRVDNIISEINQLENITEEKKDIIINILKNAIKLSRM